MKYTIVMLVLLLSYGGYTQETNLKTPTNIEECYKSLDEMLPDSTIIQFKSMNEGEAVSAVHFGLGMWIRNNWGLWESSKLSQYLVELGLNHPDDMSSVILTSYHRKLNGKEIKLIDQIEFYKSYWAGQTQFQIDQKEKQQEFGDDNIKWLNRNGIGLRDITLNGRKKIYTCDSTMLLIQILGDTTNLWTQGTHGFTDTIQLTKNKEKYGNNSYIQGIGDDGRIKFMDLKPNSFISRNDSLLECKEIYTISNDSIERIYEFAFTMEDIEQTLEYLEKMLDSNKTPVYKLIFHPRLFQDKREFVGNIQKDKITLENKWKIDSKYYYRIRIENKFGKHNTSYAYVIDEDHKFIEYEGCNSDILKRLTKEYEIE